MGPLCESGGWATTMIGSSPLLAVTFPNEVTITVSPPVAGVGFVVWVFFALLRFTWDGTLHLQSPSWSSWSLSDSLGWQAQAQLSVLLSGRVPISSSVGSGGGASFSYCVSAFVNSIMSIRDPAVTTIAEAVFSACFEISLSFSRFVAVKWREIGKPHRNWIFGKLPDETGASVADVFESVSSESLKVSFEVPLASLTRICWKTFYCHFPHSRCTSELTSCESSSRLISSPSSTLNWLGALYILRVNSKISERWILNSCESRKNESHAKAAGKIFVDFRFHCETRGMPKQNQSQLILLSPRGRLLRVNECLTTCCFGMPLVECEISWRWVAPHAFFSVARWHPSPFLPPQKRGNSKNSRGSWENIPTESPFWANFHHPLALYFGENPTCFDVAR